MPIKHEQWQQHIKDWKASGLSQTAWCKQHDLKPEQLSYWYRKFEPITVKPQTKTSPSAFIPVAVEAKTPTTPLALTLPNGASISGIDESNLALTQQLVEKLL